MATEFYKVLAQISPSAGILTDAYIVPGGRSTVISTISICNTNSVSGSFSISIAVGGEADDIKQQIYYLLPIDSHDTFTLTLGITITSTDIIRVFSDISDIAFQIWGAEIAP